MKLNSATTTALMFTMGFLWHQWFLGFSSATLLLLLFIIHLVCLARHVRTLGLAQVWMVATVWLIMLLLYTNLKSVHQGFFALRKARLEYVLAAEQTAREALSQRATVLLRSFSVMHPEPSMTEFVFVGGLATKHYAYLHTQDPAMTTAESTSRWRRVWRMDEEWYLVSD